VAFWGVFALIVLCLWSPQASRAAGPITVPQGFQDTVAIEGLTEPTQVRFAPDGRVFAAEKNGTVLVYDDINDETPTVFADLRTNVFNAYDRGLLGLAVDPEFPTRPYVYVLYTYNHQLSEPLVPPPKWPETSPGSGYEECPDPPGADTDGCVVSGRLARLTATGDQASAETVLIEDWCQQFSTHSIGELQFDSSGALYATGGEGAGWAAGPDYGQFGSPKNPCGDPPTGVGGAQEPPSAEGGALRAQDVRTPSDPTALNGTVIRIDPDTGEGLPGNPFYGSGDENAERIVAFGFRNPFRMNIDPETHEVYVGNVGWNDWEEIDRFAGTPSEAYNSGWPCYEGPERLDEYDVLDLDLCEDLYAQAGGASAPLFAYRHSEEPVPLPNEECKNVEGSAVAGMTVYRDDALPASYDGALFFADPVRSCILVMMPGEDGRPDPSTTQLFLPGGLYPGIDIEVGPEGDLYYVTLFSGEYEEGQVHRIAYSSGNQPPVAHLKVDHEYGASPLEVEFDAGESEDADGDPLSFEWDLDEDGNFETLGSGETATQTYIGSTNHTVAVRVKDGNGGQSIDRVTVYPGDEPPVPEITAPAAGLEWSVGEHISFAGEAEDPDEGTLPSTSLDWSARIAHCPPASGGGCHTHQLGGYPAVDSGSFVAPQHDYPSHILLILKATDSRGLSTTTSVQLEPEAVDLTIASNPTGLTLSGGQETGAAPLSMTVVQNSLIGLSAPLTQEMGGKTYVWDHWSDGLGRNHTITATASGTYEAFYTEVIGQHNVSVTVDGTGSGAVSANTGAISNCSKGAGTCSGLYADGSSVTLTATPAAQSSFAGWSGAGCSGTGTCVLTVDAARSVIASFAPTPAPVVHSLTVTKAGTGSGSVTCDGGPCAPGYAQGAQVSLAAAADAGSTFDGWTGACSGASGCLLTINADTAVGATFTKIPDLPGGDSAAYERCVKQANRAYRKALKKARAKHGKARTLAIKAARKKKAGALAKCRSVRFVGRVSGWTGLLGQ
jgi:glucose/arabinose dehydrogenase/PKD repeat protein